MPWFKVDDGFWSHPKVAELTNDAVALWVRAGSYATRHRTFGFVPPGCLRMLGAPQEACDELVSAGLWLPRGSGYQFHEWRKHQDGNYRPNIRRTVRRIVMERDGNRCQSCGSTEDLSLDHIVRYRDDGPDTVDNLRVLCMTCNNERG